MTSIYFLDAEETEEFDPVLVSHALVKARVKPAGLQSFEENQDLYRRAGTAPMLSAQEEAALFERLQVHGDQKAETVLMASYSRLVLSMARQHLGYGIPLPDLVQEGNIGLLKAIRRFEPERGFRLSTLAISWINAELKEYALRNTRIVRIATTKAQRKLFFNLRSAKFNLRSNEGQTAAAGLSPDDAARIAKMLCVKPSEVMEMERRLSGSEMGFDLPHGDAEEGASLSDQLSDEGDTPEESLRRRQYEWLQHEGIGQAIETLDARSRRIVKARWIEVTDAGTGLTLGDLAAEFGVSAERIRQIEKVALKKMREELSQYA